MPSGNPPAPSLKDIAATARKSAQTRSTVELAVATGASTLRAVHLSTLLLRQRNMVYSDGRRLTIADNVGHLIGLSLTALGLYMTGSEIAQRMKVMQPPRKTEDRKKPDPTEVAVSAAAIGLSLAEVKNGRTLIKKRPLSAYGRAYQALTTAASAAQIALHFRATR